MCFCTPRLPKWSSWGEKGVIFAIPMTILTTEALCSEAAIFSAAESLHPEPLLYGVTDGKAEGRRISR